MEHQNDYCALGTSVADLVNPRSDANHTYLYLKRCLEHLIPVLQHAGDVVEESISLAAAQADGRVPCNACLKFAKLLDENATEAGTPISRFGEVPPSKRKLAKRFRQQKTTS